MLLGNYLGDAIHFSIFPQTFFMLVIRTVDFVTAIILKRKRARQGYFILVAR